LVYGIVVYKGRNVKYCAALLFGGREKLYIHSITDVFREGYFGQCEKHMPSPVGQENCSSQGKQRHPEIGVVEDWRSEE